MLIIFEGLDKSGKTTLIKEFGKYECYKSILVDRGVAGYKFYDMMHHRDIINRNAILGINDDLLIVYCKCDFNDFVNRCVLHEENILYDNEKHFNDLQNIYEGIVKDIHKQQNVLILNTTNLTVNECVNKIFEEVYNE